MGSLIGHVLPGFGFLVIGLWHLLNHIKHHVQNPKSYHSFSWFPIAKIRYLELFIIMIGCTTSIAMELFVGLHHHQPFDTDGTIPSNHLHNFEHSFISMTFLVYAAFAILLDKFIQKAQYQLTELVASIAFGQELFLFHFHSTNHVSLEGQYHLLLQLLTLISLVTTLICVSYQRNFVVSFIRSTSIFFQGLWFIITGSILWTRSLIPKGCFLIWEDGHQVVKCHGDEALERAKSLANILFSWCIICVTLFALSLYLAMHKMYEGRVEYQSLTTYEKEQTNQDIEAWKEGNKLDEAKSSVLEGKSFYSIDIEGRWA